MNNIKNPYFFFIILFVLLSVTLKGQPWAEVSSENTPNFFGMSVVGNSTFDAVKNQKGKGFKPFKRWENYWEKRVFLDGSFPPADIIQNNWDSYKLKKSSTGLIPGSSWSSLGPIVSSGGYSGIGRINRITLHPTNSNIIFACSAGGGLWKTTNGGSSWVPLTDHLASIGTSGLVINPTNPDIMYLATGDGDGFNTYSFGVLKTTDGGISWTKTGLTFPIGVVIYKLHHHQSNPDMLFAGTNIGLFRSTNGGNTWTKVITSGQFYDIENLVGTNNMVAVTKGSFYRSTDAGSTWKLVHTITGTGRISIAVSNSNPDFVVALVSNSLDGFKGLYASVDGGGTYSLRSSSPNIMGWKFDGSDTGGQSWYDICVAISPVDINQIFVGGINTWKSNDGGISWKLLTHWEEGGNVPIKHADNHDIIFQNNTTLFNANDGGIYKSVDNGSTWIDITNGMTISQLYRAGAAQTDARIIAGLQDNGTKLRGINGIWTDEIGGDGMECAIDPSNGSFMFGTQQNGPLKHSADGGITWSFITPSSGADGDWVTPFLIDPVNPSTIYLGYTDLMKSTDRGTTWSKITDGQTDGNYISQIEVAPSNPKIIYVSWDSAIIKTLNGGNSWTPVKSPLDYKITSILVDPTKPNNLYITYSNFLEGAKVYFSNDGGETWTNISGTLPNIPANKIIYQKGSDGGLYLGMDVGVYYRDNKYSDWSLYNEGLPNVEIFDLEIRYTDKKLIAATYGRGLWESPLFLGLPPTVLSTTPLTGITSNSAISGGNIKSDGGADILGRGVVWSTSPNPTISLTTKTIDSVGVGSFSSSISGLIQNTTYYIRAYATNIVGTSYGNELTFKTLSLPTLLTTEITGISSIDAKSGGNITYDGGTPVSSRGVVWSTSPNPTISLATKTIDGVGIGSFSSIVKGLTSNKTYYLRAYATNAGGIGYGNELVFKTLSIPSLTTIEINRINNSSITTGGNITSDGGAIVTARGVVWSTSPNPTVGLSTKTIDGDGVGSFTSSISGLLTNTTYYIKSYAVNSIGTAYGNEIIYKTNDIPTLSTTAITNITSTSALSGGDINSDGGSAVTARGVVWSTTSSPTVSLTTKTSNGTGPGVFTSSVTGLTANTIYYVRAYASNSTGTGYGKEIQIQTLVKANPALLTTKIVTEISSNTAKSGGDISSDGGGYITSRGVVWSRNNSPSISLPTKTTDGKGSGSYVTEISNLTPNKKYYYRAYATNSAGTSYGLQYKFKSARASKMELPIISSTPVFNITSISAMGGGEIKSDAGSAVTTRGVVWSTSPNPTISLTTKTNNGAGIGLFSSTLSGLLPGTKYYIRAYAITSKGPAYGPELTFSTLSTEVDISSKPCPGIETIKDIDGNIYNTVQIGKQCWTKENLKAAHYRDGSLIPLDESGGITGNTLTQSWGTRTQGARTLYSQNPVNLTHYGYLYNFHAVVDSRGICPQGWHVPTDIEWTALVNYLGGELVAGGKLKSKGTTYWKSSNARVTDEIGFSALPGGYRFSDGKFYQLNTDGFYWSSTNSGSNTAWYRYFIDFQDNTYRKNSFNRTVGASLRCIKDIPPQGIFPEISPSKNIFFEGEIDSAKSYLTEVNSHFSENKLIIYPNPSDGKFSLVFQDYEIKKPLKLILTDGLGRTIKFFYPIDLENNMELDLTKFIGNVFFLRVIYEGETMTKKMLKH